MRTPVTRRNRSWIALLGALALAGACSDADKGTAAPSGGGAFTPTDTTDGTGGNGWGGNGPDTAGPKSDTTTPDTTIDPDAAGDASDGTCTPNTAKCIDPDTRGVCALDGLSYMEAACEAGTKCFQGYCTAPVCEPLAPHDPPECTGPTTFKRCNESGTAFEDGTCEGGLTCYLGECTSLICAPDSAICFGTTGLKRCKADGSGYGDPEPCTDGGLCQIGPDNQAFCADACGANIKQNSYLGCDYWAVDLDNYEEGADAQVALVVSAPPGGADATVTITNMLTGEKLDLATTGAPSDVVAKGTLQTFMLPLGHDLDGSTKVMRSFRVVTTAPVTVHQFNPLNGDNVWTNDASLLLPSNVGGQEYYVMSWPHRNDGAKAIHGFLTVVATQAGVTNVSVTPRGTVAAGPGLPGTMVAGQTYDFQLAQGEVLNLETDGNEGQDLTGSYIKADKKIAVFGGHECANVPLGVNFCDHVEQQLYPVHAWGEEYVADMFMARSAEQFDMFRVMGGDDDIFVQTDPPVPGYESFTLNKGQFVQFLSARSFTIKGTGRLLVGHYMVGSSYPGADWTCGGTGIGDPALTLAVPTSQFLKQYVVLTPPNYEQDYLNIVAKPGTQITVDGTPMATELTAIGGSEWAVAQVLVDDGVHTIEGDAPFGLTAYGYDCDVSYAYPGGLKLDATGNQ